MELSLKWKMILQSKMKKNWNGFENWFQNEIEPNFSFDFKLNVKVKFTFETRIFYKGSFTWMGHYTAALKLIHLHKIITYFTGRY